MFCSLLFQADIVNIIKEVKSIEVKFGMKTITLEVNGSNTFADVKEMLAAMEGIEAETLAMITFQGKQRADEQLLGNIDNIQPNGSRFYATRRPRGGGKAIKKDKNMKDERILLLKAKLDNRRTMLGNDGIFNRVKHAVSTLNETMGTAFKTELKGMNLEKCQVVSDTFYESSAHVDRFMKEMAPTLIPLVTELDTHINDLTSAKAMLVTAFELSYTAEFFSNGKLQHTEFEDLVRERLNECLKDAEVERRVAERMASAGATMDE